MPVIKTRRLLIREFTPNDLDDVHRILDVELGFTSGSEAQHSRSEREAWLDWTCRNYGALAALFQFPLGDRAIVSRDTGTVIGAIGYVPEVKPFAQIPGFYRSNAHGGDPALSTSEIGLFWALAPAHQGNGYATEAARAMVEYAFTTWHLARIVATTGYDNAASAAVMTRLGMRVTRNPLPDPPWLQVAGVLDNSAG